MNFSYFFVNGLFVAKRLPSPKDTIKIKDYTDLENIRDIFKDCDTKQRIIEYYLYFSRIV